MNDDTIGKVLGTIAGFAGLGFVGAALATRKSSPRPNPNMSAKGLQDELVEILTHPQGGVDGRDFDLLLDEYADQTGIDLPEDDRYELLEDEKFRRKFERWILDNDMIPTLQRQEPSAVPARYWFGEPERLPPGTWLTHHSDESFYEFDRGSTPEYLGHTGGGNVSRAERLSGKNLSDEISYYERVYGFAFLAKQDECIDRRGECGCSGRRPKYGENILLFQCDSAVMAHHYADDELQVIFPIGTEYNVTSLTCDRYDSSWHVDDPVTGDDVKIPTFNKVIQFLELGEKRRDRPEEEVFVVVAGSDSYVEMTPKEFRLFLFGAGEEPAPSFGSEWEEEPELDGDVHWFDCQKWKSDEYFDTLMEFYQGVEEFSKQMDRGDR